MRRLRSGRACRSSLRLLAVLAGAQPASACNDETTDPGSDLVEFSVDTVHIGEELSVAVELDNLTDGPLGMIDFLAGPVTYSNGVPATGLGLSVSPVAIPSLPFGSSVAVDIDLQVQPDAQPGGYLGAVYALIGTDTAATVITVVTLTQPPESRVTGRR